METVTAAEVLALIGRSRESSTSLCVDGSCFCDAVKCIPGRMRFNLFDPLLDEVEQKAVLIQQAQVEDNQYANAFLTFWRDLLSKRVGGQVSEKTAFEANYHGRVYCPKCGVESRRIDTAKKWPICEECRLPMGRGCKPVPFEPIRI